MKRKTFTSIIGIISLIGVVLVAGCISGDTVASQAFDSGVDNKIVIYKSESCGCCVGYISELEGQGFDVEMKIVSDMEMSTIKTEKNIPRNMQSCHTAVIGDYFIEGHVPIEAVTQMLVDQPQINGIALPGMPPGSPGMPGIKSGSFEVYALSDIGSSLYMKV